GRGGSEPSGGGGMGGGRGGAGRGGGGGGAGPDEGANTPLNPEYLRAVQAMLDEVLRPPERLTIAVADSEIAFTESGGGVVRLPTNNKSQKHQLLAGTAEIKTRWEGDKLVKETSLLGLAQVREIYSVTPDSHLQVDVRLQRARVQETTSFKRVYDRSAP